MVEVMMIIECWMGLLPALIHFLPFTLPFFFPFLSSICGGGGSKSASRWIMADVEQTSSVGNLLSSRRLEYLYFLSRRGSCVVAGWLRAFGMIEVMCTVVLCYSWTSLFRYWDVLRGQGTVLRDVEAKSSSIDAKSQPLALFSVLNHHCLSINNRSSVLSLSPNMSWCT